MNEETKNIETCLPENILAEVASVPTDPQFRSLVNESLDPLQQQALRQAGYDGYIKVAGKHQPYTFTSQVKQMKSNLILLLRRLWRFQFGRGTIRSLADMWQHYITRLKGNPEYGIPSRLSQLTDLPAAPALLVDRKISGVPEAEDGMSMARILCDSAVVATITEITDDTEEWTWNRSNPLTMFSSLEKITTNCKIVTRCIAKNNNTLTSVLTPSLREVNNDVQQDGFITNCPNVVDVDFSELETFYVKYENAPLTGTAIGPIKGPDVLEFPKLRSAYILGNCQAVFVLTETRVLKFPVLTTIPYIGNAVWIQGCPNLEELYMPKFGTMQSAAGWPTMITNLPKLKKLVLGVTSITTDNSGTCVNLSSSLGLIELHLGEGQIYNTDLHTWSPTLDSSNLQQFLSNFKTYIAERLTDKGTGLTITLSQEVRNAIHAAEDEYGIENIIITQKGWTISPAPN